MHPISLAVQQIHTHTHTLLQAPTSTVLDLPLAEVEWHHLVALFPVIVAGEFVTSQALLAVVLDAGRSTASARAVGRAGVGCSEGTGPPKTTTAP